jgi:hypothetical protein
MGTTSSNQTTLKVLPEKFKLTLFSLSQDLFKFLSSFVAFLTVDKKWEGENPFHSVQLVSLQ